MTIIEHPEVIQGSEQWMALRCGMLTSSEMENIITPSTLKLMTKKKDGEEIDHLWELFGQRITKYVEPQYIGDHMLRGQQDELDAKLVYNKEYAPLRDIGFITNDKWGFTLGYSPDGLVGDDGIIEVKSRLQKFQAETILSGKMPDYYRIQVQTELLVSERKWCDFISYCGGMPMITIRVEPDKAVQDAIVEAATAFHEKLEKKVKEYAASLVRPGIRLMPTERRIEQEIGVGTYE